MQETWDFGLIPGLGWSHGEGQGNPLLYSCLENPMDRGVWRAICLSIGSQRVGHNWNNLAHMNISFVVVVQSPSCVQLFETPKTVTHQASCPSPSPRVCPSACPLHQWCHPATSSSNALFYCCQFFSTSGSFTVRQLFASGDQNIGVSASSILPISYSGLIFFKID